MRPWLWSLGPTLLLMLVGLSAAAAPGGSADLVFFSGPVVLGMMQWAALHPRLGGWGWLWVPACCLGLFLSLSCCGIWSFHLCLGLGLGLAQAPLLALVRLRRLWLWPLASGAGWSLGMLAGSRLDWFPPGPAGDIPRLTVLYGVTLLSYSLSTALALSTMGGWGSRDCSIVCADDLPPALAPGETAAPPTADAVRHS